MSAGLPIQSCSHLQTRTPGLSNARLLPLSCWEAALPLQAHVSAVRAYGASAEGYLLPWENCFKPSRTCGSSWFGVRACERPGKLGTGSPWLAQGLCHDSTGCCQLARAICRWIFRCMAQVLWTVDISDSRQRGERTCWESNLPDRWIDLYLQRPARSKANEQLSFQLLSRGQG